MRITDFDLYRDILKGQMGMALRPQQAFLIDSRLLPVARKWGYNNLQTLAVALRAMPEPALLRDVTEAMTDTETRFFRDETPFAQLRDIVVPALLNTRARKKRLRLWSCGCGTGQEAWSLAIALKDIPELAGWRIDIVATDIATDALDYAARATYAQFEVQRGLPIDRLIKWFDQDGKSWRVRDELRRLVHFESFNVVRDDSADMGLFDIVMFRHVLDHCEDDTKAVALENVAAALAPDGFMLTGPAENPPGLTDWLLPLPDSDGLCVLGDAAFSAESA
jgi:chemotaxis protein methyltransferase CheR